ncbi:MAG TPA: GntR family transcriptional regulator [Propionicimonas sp.]|nr:GntR family transcriptional regulator [Propionicimonas sp.]HRA06475.1 GntR family transcriptional regulator [Propionicimonas sp.]
MTATLERTHDLTAVKVPLIVDRDSPVPLYHQVAEQLTKAIADGVLKPGDAFENEVSLAQRLDLSRPTVRRSIGELVTKGLLVRRRGIGTTVAHEAVHRRNELTSLYDDLAADGRKPSTRVLRMSYAETDDRAARMLELDRRTPLVYLERLRVIEGTPIALLKNWLPPTFSDISASELEAGGLYDWFRRHHVAPVVAHQTIGGRPSLPEERSLLGLGRLDPVLTMTRRAYDSAGTPVEFGDHCYRADRYKFDVTVHAT